MQTRAAKENNIFSMYSLCIIFNLSKKEPENNWQIPIMQEMYQECLKAVHVLKFDEDFEWLLYIQVTIRIRYISKSLSQLL